MEKIITTFSLAKELVKDFKQHCKQKGQTMSAVLSELIKKELKRAVK